MTGTPTVVIVGGGPAGSTLAALLADAGAEVTLFTGGRRPPLVVGESLVPPVVRLFRRLGIEDDVARAGVRKAGAVMGLPDGCRWEVDFGSVAGGGYAYNIRRDLLDAVLRRRAGDAGARISDAVARFTSDGRTRPVPDAATRDAWGGGEPDLIVDATGRKRLFSKLLRVPAEEGGRDDVALFAHFDRSFDEERGRIHIDVLSRGWAWRIPLGDRTSVGVVVPRDGRPGVSAEETFEGVLDSDDRLASFVSGARRLSGVASYANYQLVSSATTGPGWALVGDAAGFLDPMFSSGTHLALLGAEILADSFLAGGAWRAAYDRRLRREYDAWRGLIGAFYSGAFPAFVRAGVVLGESAAARFAPSVGRVVAGVACDADRAEFGYLMRCSAFAPDRPGHSAC